MNGNPWIKADAWFRRDVGDGVASLTVCRTAGGTWTWTFGTSAGVVKRGEGFTSALAAKAAADAHLVLAYGAAV